MDKPYTGGCACGAIRYSIASEPLFANHCQPLDLSFSDLAIRI